MKHRRYRRPVRKPRNVVLRSRFKMERRRRVRKAAQYLLLLGLGGLLLWFGVRGMTQFLFRSDHFTIRTIDIAGDRNVSRSEILALLPFRPGDNMLRVLLSKAERQLRRSRPELKSVEISRRWKRIVVRIEERTPLACITVGGQRFGVDEDNVPFPLRGRLAREPLPEIAAKSEYERKEVLEFIKIFAPQARELFPKIVRLSPEPINSVVIDLKDHMRIYWGSCERAAIRPKLQRLAQVLDDAKERFGAIEYVNLSCFDDGRIIIKPLTKTADQQAFSVNGSDPI